MIFDRPPAELPVAVVMPKSRGAQLATGLAAWLTARWRWIRPRTVPIVVAVIGMFAVIAFANYLKNYGREDARPERLTPPPVVEPVAEKQPEMLPALEVGPGCVKRLQSVHE